MKKILLGLIFVLVALTIAGCINYSEESWINENGSGKIKMEVNINEALMNMVPEGGQEKLFSGDEIKKQFKNNKDIKLISYKTFNREEAKVVKIELEFNSVGSLGSAEKNDKKSGNTGFLGQVSIKKNRKGQIIFSRVLSTNTIDKSKKENDEYGAVAEQMMAGMLSNYIWRYTIHFPYKVISANTADDYIDFKNNTVRWDFTLGSIIKKPPKMTAVLQPYNFFELILRKLNLYK